MIQSVSLASSKSYKQVQKLEYNKSDLSFGVKLTSKDIKTLAIVIPSDVLITMGAFDPLFHVIKPEILGIQMQGLPISPWVDGIMVIGGIIVNGLCALSYVLPWQKK